MSTWWLAVCIGGPIRPTGAALCERPGDGSATLHSAIRLDSSGLSEDEQAAALADQVAERAARAPLVVILARAAGVGRDLEQLWRDAMPRRSAVRPCPLPRGAEESGRAREDLVTAVYLARSRRQLYADAEVNAALDTYISQRPAPYGETLDPHDCDPQGIAVPCALAVHHSDPSRQTTIHAATDRRAIDRSRWSSPPYSPGVPAPGQIGADAERRAGLRPPGRRIVRPTVRPDSSGWW